MDQPIVKFVSQSGAGNNDCTVASLAMLLGLNYAEALVLLASVRPRVLELGAEWEHVIRAARKKKVVLKRVLAQNADLDDDELTGILNVRLIEGGKALQHTVYMTRGLIFDGRTDACYEPDVYLKSNNADVLSLLVKV